MKNSRKVTTVLALLIGLLMSAQDNSTPNAKVGFKGGINLSNLYVDDVDDENVLTGFNAGLFFDLPLSKNVSLQPEVSYTVKGAEVTYDNLLVSGTTKYRLNYIEVPVLLKATILPGFNIHFGPYAAFLVDAKITNESTNATFNFEQNIDKSDLNTIDAGLALGTGIDLGNFGIGVRYNYGLTKVGKEQNYAGTTYTFPNGKNSVLNIYATIKF